MRASGARLALCPKGKVYSCPAPSLRERTVHRRVSNKTIMEVYLCHVNSISASESLQAACFYPSSLLSSGPPNRRSSSEGATRHTRRQVSIITLNWSRFARAMTVSHLQHKTVILFPNRLRYGDHAGGQVPFAVHCKPQICIMRPLQGGDGHVN
jgi:hypothetical protein